jgi:hypothetical protein
MSATETNTVQPRISASQSTPPRRPPRRRRTTRWIVGGAGVALVGLVLGLAGVGPSGGSGASDRSRQEVVVGDTGSAAGSSAVEGGQPTPQSQSQGPAVLDQTGDTPQVEEPAVLDQAGDTPEVEEPQEPAAPLPATLSVSPDPVHLKTGVYSGSITVANVGDEAMHWEALTKPWVSLSDMSGDLGGHGENVITFTINDSQLEAGSFTFKIKVWGNGGTEYVDVTGAKPLTEISI